MRLTHKKGYADGPFGQLHYMTCGEGTPPAARERRW
jgi:hypothetical protein